MLAALFIAASSGTSFAQAGCDDTDGMNALDAEIRKNYPKNATVKAAIDAGKSYLEKYGACEVAKEFVDWMKVQMPKWEERHKKWEVDQKLAALYKRFDAGITGDNADEVFAAGKEILAAKPDDLNIMVPMAMSGILQSYKNNPKFADESLRISKTVIAKLKAGAEPTKKNPQGVGTYGALKLEFTKEELLDELPYGNAYITYWVKKERKTALPMYYEISQSAGKYKNEPRVYGSIGDHYVEEVAKLGEEIAAMIAKQKAMATDEEKEKIDVDIKAKVGLFNGYSERAIDAYARAHKVAPTATASDTTYKNELLKKIQVLYVRRFDKETGMDAYIAATTAKPFPNPTSEVTPINDPDPVTTTTSGVGAATGNGVGAASGNGVGAANGNGVGTPQGSAANRPTATPAKPVVKKP